MKNFCWEPWMFYLNHQSSYYMKDVVLSNESINSNFHLVNFKLLMFKMFLTFTFGEMIQFDLKKILSILCGPKPPSTIDFPWCEELINESQKKLLTEEILHQLRLVVYSIIFCFFTFQGGFSPDAFHQQKDTGKLIVFWPEDNLVKLHYYFDPWAWQNSCAANNQSHLKDIRQIGSFPHLTGWK